MTRAWLPLLFAAAFAPIACTTEQDLGNRAPDGGPGPDGGNPAGHMRAFVTRARYSGDLRTPAKRASGLDAGDALCELAAEGAQIGGHWAAWLSDADMDAIDRVDDDGPWYNTPPSGTPSEIVFRNRAGIGTGPLGYLYDEYSDAYAQGASYWSGTSPGGRANGQDCNSWSSDAEVKCSQDDATTLLCLEQKVASYRKRVFVTSKTFPGDFSLPSKHPNETADGYCYDAAKAAGLGGTWRAWLSASDQDGGSFSKTYSGADRLASRTSSWTLLDGTTLVFSSRDEMGTTPEHAIDHDEYNHPVPAGAYVWTNTSPKGDIVVSTSTGYNCLDFTATYSGYWATVGVVGATETGAWTATSKLLTCDQSAHFYCFEQ